MSFSQSIQLDKILENFKGKSFTTETFVDELAQSFPTVLIKIDKNIKQHVNTYIAGFLNAKKRQGKVLSSQKTLPNHQLITLWEVEDLEAFEMANLRQKTTGLPMVIWVSEKGHTQHGPRIKVSKIHSDKMDITQSVSVSITSPPEIVAGAGLSPQDFEVVSRYIELNKKVLLGYWNGELDTAELIGGLKKLKC